MSLRVDLAAYLQEAAARGFRYGRHDCALFALGWVRLRNPDLRFSHADYSSLKGGKAALKEMGFQDHIDAAKSVLRERSVLFAQVGDIAVFCQSNKRKSLGIVCGERSAFLSHSGLIFMPSEKNTMALEVPK